MSVYFIRNMLTGNIKIGWTERSIAKRMSALQTGNEGRLELLFEVEHGTRKTEAHLHEKFAYHRIRGEWFRYGEEIKLFINRYKNRKSWTPHFDLILKAFLEKTSPGRGWFCQCAELAGRGASWCCGFCAKRRQEVSAKMRKAAKLQEQRDQMRRLESCVAIEYRDKPMPTDVLRRLLALREEFTESKQALVGAAQ